MALLASVPQFPQNLIEDQILCVDETLQIVEIAHTSSRTVRAMVARKALPEFGIWRIMLRMIMNNKGHYPSRSRPRRGPARAPSWAVRGRVIAAFSNVAQRVSRTSAMRQVSAEIVAQVRNPDYLEEKCTWLRWPLRLAAMTKS